MILPLKKSYNSLSWLPSLCRNNNKTTTTANGHHPPHHRHHRAVGNSHHHHPQQQQHPTMEVVIFLDIDGVLLPVDMDVSQPCVFPKQTMHALNAILHGIPSNYTISIVLSSTWRVAECYQNQIRQAFVQYGSDHPTAILGNIITNFVDVTDPKYHEHRQWEIHRYLQHYQRRHPTHRIKAWIAIDDTELLQGDKNQIYHHVFDQHVVQTNPNIGLTMDNAHHAIALLQEQLLLTPAGTASSLRQQQLLQPNNQTPTVPSQEQLLPAGVNPTTTQKIAAATTTATEDTHHSFV